jgi:hypothetical protein
MPESSPRSARSTLGAQTLANAPVAVRRRRFPMWELIVAVIVGGVVASWIWAAWEMGH